MAAANPLGEATPWVPEAQLQRQSLRGPVQPKKLSLCRSDCPSTAPGPVRQLATDCMEFGGLARWGHAARGPAAEGVR